MNKFLFALVSLNLIFALLITSTNANDLIIAQIGDSVGAHPNNRLATENVYDGNIRWIGDNHTASGRPTFARGGWRFFEMLNGRTIPGLENDGLVHHVVNPAYPTPDIVYLVGGYNDAGQATSVESITERFQYVIDIVNLVDISWGSDVYIATITNFPEDRMWAHRQPNVEAYNALLFEFARTRSNVYVVDNNAIISNDLIAADGLHLTVAGQVVIGESFAQLPVCPLDVAIPPDSITAFRGIQTAGELSSFSNSDNQRAVFTPGFILNSSESPVWLEFNTSTAQTATNFLVESRANTPGIEFELEAWNWNDNSFRLLGSNDAPFGNDGVFVFPIEPKDHISPRGEARTRVGWRQTGFIISFPWRVEIDQAGWNE